MFRQTTERKKKAASKFSPENRETHYTRFNVRAQKKERYKKKTSKLRGVVEANMGMKYIKHIGQTDTVVSVYMVALFYLSITDTQPK